MNTKKKKKSILEMGNGSILEKVDREYGKVLKNIQDPNTDPVKVREITDHERKNPSILAQVTSKLQPVNPIKVNLFDVEVLDQETGEAIKAQQEASDIASGQINIDGEIHVPEVYIPHLN